MQAEAVAERLRAAVTILGSPEGGPPLEITCGVAELTAGQQPEELIASADRDLLVRKQGSLR